MTRLDGYRRRGSCTMTILLISRMNFRARTWAGDACCGRANTTTPPKCLRKSLPVGDRVHRSPHNCMHRLHGKGITQEESCMVCSTHRCCWYCMLEWGPANSTAELNTIMTLGAPHSAIRPVRTFLAGMVHAYHCRTRRH